MEIIARETEIALLDSIAKSGVPEFIAVYGRRRVGKTFFDPRIFQWEPLFRSYHDKGKQGNRPDVQKAFM